MTVVTYRQNNWLLILDKPPNFTIVNKEDDLLAQPMKAATTATVKTFQPDAEAKLFMS